MKKLIAILLLILITFSCFPLSFTAYSYSRSEYVGGDFMSAENKTFARVLSSDIAFYKNAGDETPLFFLPYSYYVKVLNYSEPFSHVECYGANGQPSLDGYCLSESLYFDSAMPKNPYLSLKISNRQMTALYSSLNDLEPMLFLSENRSLCYYGYSFNESGETFYLVSYLNKLGYVKDTDVYVFNFTPHENPLPQLIKEESEVSQPVKPQNNKASNLKIAIIVCLGFATLIIIFSLIKPKNKAKEQYFDNDYE